MDGSQADPLRARPAGDEPVAAVAATEETVLPPVDPTGAPGVERSRRERALSRRVGRLRDDQARLEQELIDLRHNVDARTAEADRLRRELGVALNWVVALAARLREFGDVTPEEFFAQSRRRQQELTAREEEIKRRADEAERLMTQARQQAAELMVTARAEAESRIERDRRDAHRHAEATAEKIVARAENRAEALLAEAELQLRRLRGESRSTIALPDRPAFRIVRNGYVKGQVNNFVGWAKKAASDPLSAPAPPSTNFRNGESGYEPSSVDAYVRTVLGLIRQDPREGRQADGGVP